MKKLLSLLSVLTISGTAVPTTIATSPYQKEKIKLKNNDINYSQVNNLENLNRNKKDTINDSYTKIVNFNGSTITAQRVMEEIPIRVKLG